MKTIFQGCKLLLLHRTKNIFSLVKDLNCQFITQVNFQYTLEISRFKKIDAICFRYEVLRRRLSSILKDYASDNTLNPTLL